MKKEIEIFALIVTSTVFAYLKEHYPHYELKDSDDNKNIAIITELLQKLEKYAHIPDKKRLVKESYSKFKDLIENESFKESEILSSLEQDTKALSQVEKEDILNSVIFVVNADKKISDVEKELILQISNFLNLPYAYKEIITQYQKSEFKIEQFPIRLVLLGLLILLGIGGFFFWKTKNVGKVQTFNTNKYQFDEITFNRYVMYKNKFDIKNNELTNHFKKYAVYYITGTAQVSFNPKKINYDAISKKLTLTEDFQVDLLISQKDEIDKVHAKAISEGTAQTLGIVVGLAGAYGGAKAGSGLTKILPKTMGWAATGVGGLVGGATGYLVTKNVLNGEKVTSEISMSDKKETLKIGEQLIRVQLQTDEGLKEMYREHFETFIRAKYRTLNKEVNEVKYDISETNEVKK